LAIITFRFKSLDVPAKQWPNPPLPHMNIVSTVLPSHWAHPVIMVWYNSRKNQRYMFYKVYQPTFGCVAENVAQNALKVAFIENLEFMIP